MAENNRLLIGAADLGLNEIADKTHLLNGLSIASHIDRPSYSIMSQFGFIPPDLDLDGVEIPFPHSSEEIHEHIFHLKNMTCATFSDAHFPHASLRPEVLERN